MLNNGYVKITAIVPDVKIGNPKENANIISNEIRKANEKYNSNIYITGELSLTSCSCGDLFFQNQLFEETLNGIKTILKLSEEKDMESKLIVIGAPIINNNKLFNCALFIQNNKIIAIVPKTYLNNNLNENRWFHSSNERINDFVNILDMEVPFSENILLKDKESDLIISSEIGSDLWSLIPPSTINCYNGSNLVLNLSASNDLIKKEEYREELVKTQSFKTISSYVYVSSGINESTTNTVYSGHVMFSECGSLLLNNKSENKVYTEIIDINKINNRRKNNCINNILLNLKNDIKYVYFETGLENNKKEKINPYPFVPQNENELRKRCNEIINIQSQALATRLLKTNINKVVLGISGGLDSTLALIVAKEAFEKNNFPMKNIIGITMPGFGTSKRTLENSLTLMKEIGISNKNISIEKACTQHFKDIGHDENTFDITYENTQARERTQILFDIANQEGGLVIGTGNLSELALGWCTYNGDHMSNYSVNANIPKTLVKSLIKTIADIYKENGNEELFKVLYDILGTPISPELLPLKNGIINQKTENSIGKYDLHDFFLYHKIRNCFSDKKIKEMAYIAFDFIDKKEIDNTFEIFNKRFYTQQFKRNCSVDGPIIGSVSLNPFNGFIMPSDISIN